MGCLACATLLLSVLFVCSFCLTSGLVRTSRILAAFDICHPSTLSIVRFVMAYLIEGCCSGAPSFSFLGAMYDRTTTLPAPIGIFIKTDQRWKQLQAEQKFYRLSHYAPTPSITTIQQLGLVIVHAFSTLNLTSFKKLVHSQTSPAFDH